MKRPVVLIGFPVGHSLSERMQNAAFKHLGLDLYYYAAEIRPEELPEAIRGLSKLGFAGANVTIPYKEQVLPFLDHLDQSGYEAQAVNTVVCRDGKLWGYNTDGEGFIRSLAEEGIVPRGKVFCLIGAGGAARGVAQALVRQGAACIYFINRTPKRAFRLVEDISHDAEKAGSVLTTELKALPWCRESFEAALSRAQVLVNCSPVGMYPRVFDSPLPYPELLRPSLVVYDLVYNPYQTALLREAASRGCQTISGLGMLVYQGAAAFSLWTGMSAPVEIMWAAAKSSITGER